MNDRRRPRPPFPPGRPARPARRAPERPLGPPRAAEEPVDGLRAVLRAIDGGPYPEYRRLLGRHALGEFELAVERVPPDPFAGGARVRLIVSRERAGLPADLADTPARRRGTEDHLARSVARALREQEERGGQPPPGTGRIVLEPPGPAMVERAACRIGPEAIELRLEIDLPSDRRRALARQAEELLFVRLARLATATLLFGPRRVEEARAAADLAEDHAFLQEELPRRGLVAFVADGALLARAGGDDESPRRDGREVPFAAPPERSVALTLPRGGRVTGLGIPAGVTVIAGGAFHGKSTLVDALAAGVHPHPPGDGRERVATVAAAVTVRTEPGRVLRGVDLSGFLGEIPSGERPSSFTTERASGSTSQAAAVVEAVEAGARLLLVDEDTSAGNFLVRDGRMQRLVPRPQEPIVPFLDRVRELYDRLGVSTVLAVGGSGDYLEAADVVLVLDGYRCQDATLRARAIAEATRTVRLAEPVPALVPPAPRPARLSVPDGARRTGLRGPRAVRVGEDLVDLHALAQLVEAGQVRALARLLGEAPAHLREGMTVADLAVALDRILEEGGLEALGRDVHGTARPRRFEIHAALSRWRALGVRR